jgi:calcium-dependent protein kinase
MKKKSVDAVKLDRKAFIRKSNSIDESYDVTRKALATGSYGAVHQCTHKITREKRVVKIIPKYKMADVAGFLNEIEIMRMVVTLCLRP